MNKVLYPDWLTRALRTDHAGETGAVWIYRGILTVSVNNSVRTFAQRHLKTELKHLNKIESLLSLKHRSRLLPVWKIAGFFTGVIPALCGSDMTFHTIKAVETFVSQHYQNQLDSLQPIIEHIPELAIVRSVLSECQFDEIAHRDEAAQSVQNAPGIIIRLWCLLVYNGSQAAVTLARQI
jgi:ubiquinone biosynthesis monooxygenase Coq7